MFGLDARIALAIFGALSVITGVSLYNVLEKSSLVSILTDLREVGKAFEQYYLNTHKLPPFNSTNYNSYEGSRFKTGALVVQPTGVKNWKGPYLKYTVNGNALDIFDDKKIALLLLDNNKSFGGASNVGWENAYCSANKNCSVWLYYSGHKTSDELKLLDKMVDGEIDGAKGDFHWNYYPASAWGPASYVGYLKYMAVPNPF